MKPRPRPRTLAEQGVRLLEEALQKNPPPGVSGQAVAAFFRKHRAQLTEELMQAMAQAAASNEAPSSQSVPCGCRHKGHANKTGVQKS